MNNMEIRRGDIFNVMNGGRFAGGATISGFRPAVVVSNNMGNHFANCVEVVYLTSQEKKPLPTHASVMCRVPSTALCEQIDTVGKEKLGEYVRTCTDAEMKRIDAALLVSLGLNTPGSDQGGRTRQAQRTDRTTRARTSQSSRRSATRTNKCMSRF